ncbi:MAG: hypothetical protein JRF33_27645 [Deltaproteobacteria bacterium]|nr:hypothetical protein [Deltaproteobacteria bacterium]
MLVCMARPKPSQLNAVLQRPISAISRDLIGLIDDFRLMKGVLKILRNGRGDKPSQAAAGLARFFLLAFLGKEGQCDGEQQKEREKNRFHGEF